MSQYAIHALQQPKLLLKQPSWGLSRGRRKSAASLLNALRVKRTEIASRALAPFRQPWGMIQAG